ncbi:MAG TPA: hypothetical protein VKU02_25270 [Gemmataceae bacterium]|nr:hypothetical protein [Gemmataceae bacterium]
MKAEHRHQLHTNELADRMGRLLQGMRSAPKSTSTLIWVFVLLALASFAVWQYAISATVRQRSSLWTGVDEATHDPAAGTAKLLSIEARNPGTTAARAARFDLARWNMQQGILSLASEDRVRALPMLKDSHRLYTELLPHCVDAPLLAQEAMLGRATAEETLAGLVEPTETAEAATSEKSDASKEEKRAGSLDRALEYYQELAKKYPDSPAGKTATERIGILETSRKQVEELYAKGNEKAAPKANIPIPKMNPVGP